jgi:predicted DCC family thiol-disulfide oxidoreductase YuxK
MLNKYGIFNTKPETLVFIKNKNVFTKSKAVLEISKNLDGCYKTLSIGIIIPKFFRDWIYLKIAKNRYQWFGKKETCLILSHEIRGRFL